MDYKKLAQDCFEKGEFGLYIHYSDLYEQLKNKLINSKTFFQGTGEKKENSENFKYIFITYNPPQEIELDFFKKTMERVVKKNWISRYDYVFEQRSEDPDKYHGVHCHMLLEYRKDKSNSEVIREIANTVKKIVDTSNVHLFNTKFIQYDEYLRKIKYITELKADNAKHKKQAVDIIFRETNNLLSLYTNRECPSTHQSQENEDIIQNEIVKE